MANEMQMIDFIESGIRAEVLRQKSIANNIANMNTPGYRRTDVQFEELLEKEIGKGKRGDVRDLTGEVFKPMSTKVKGNGNDVSLEMEVGQMVKNSLRHQAYTNMLKKKYQQIQLAIRTT
jgi:flagellar basal-body rod protein FlgB